VVKRISSWKSVLGCLVVCLTLASVGLAQDGVALPLTPPTKTVVFPLSEVKPGLRGVAYTVFEGVNPEPMEVEILGVLKNALGPGQDMILARLHGKKPEYTGVVAGMSGSPVYIDGRLLGALSYRIGQFSKEPIAGITPIERMLEVRDEDVAKDKAKYGGLSPAGAKAQASVERTSFSLAPKAQASLGYGEVTPIETPLVFGGFSEEAVERFGDRFKAMGLSPVAGLGGSDATAKQPEPLIPGSAVSAVLVEGDLSMSGTCTVTYVDKTHLLACGHPITQFGAVSMPMTKAEVLATLPSPLNAFKIINTTETVGAFTEDRASAIMGRFGEVARMIPVTVDVKDAGGRTRTTHFRVLDNKELTPSTMLVSVYQSLQQTNGAAAEISYRISGELQVEGEAAVKLEGIMAPNELNPAAINTALYINDRFGKIYANTEEQPVVTGLRLEAEAIGDRKTATIEEARLGRTEVRAGETVDVEVTLRPYQGAPQMVRVPVRIPVGAAPGEMRLAVTDAGAADRMTELQNHGRPVSLRDMVGEMNRSRSNDGIYVTLLEHDAQAVLEGGTMAAVPLSMANVLAPLKAEQRMQLTGETAVELGSVATGYVVSGVQVIVVHVR
jgi:hypothetical protein